MSMCAPGFPYRVNADWQKVATSIREQEKKGSRSFFGDGWERGLPRDLTAAAAIGQRFGLTLKPLAAVDALLRVPPDFVDFVPRGFSAPKLPRHCRHASFELPSPAREAGAGGRIIRELPPASQG